MLTGTASARDAVTEDTVRADILKQVLAMQLKKEYSDMLEEALNVEQGSKGQQRFLKIMGIVGTEENRFNLQHVLQIIEGAYPRQRGAPKKTPYLLALARITQATHGLSQPWETSSLLTIRIEYPRCSEI